MTTVPPGDDDLAVAVDVGGTKLSVGVVTAAGALLERHDAPTRAGGEGTPDAEALFATLAALVDRTAPHHDRVRVVGVGCGGPMTAGGEEVSPLNIPAWRGFPLRARLAAHLDRPTFVDNDAKALALGEGWVGAAAGESHFLAMVVSTGVGGGIVCDGRLLDGAAGNAGHIGHVIVEPEGRACPCGARGCLEAEASGTAIAAITGADPADAPAGLRVRTGTLVGRAVGSVANLLDLRLAAVAGSVALGFGDAFFTAAQQELDRTSRIAFARGARIVPAGLGASGPLVGAARVGWRGLLGTPT